MDDCHEEFVIKKKKSLDSIFTLFSNLTGEKNANPKFCLDLVRNLRGQQFNVGSGNNLEYSLKRIVRGLGSTRLYSQCGCFAALTSVLRYQICSVNDVLEVLEKEQRPGVGATKSEIRALNTSCVLTCGAIIHSGLFNNESTEKQQIIINKIIETSKNKSYLLSVAYRFLVDIVHVSDICVYKEVILPVLKSDLLENLDGCNADGFYLLFVCLKQNYNSFNKFLKKNFSSPDLIFEKALTLLLNSFIKYDHPIYDIVCHYICTSAKLNSNFWLKCVNENTKISFHKDAVLIILFCHIIKNLQDVTMIPELLVPRLLEIFIKFLSFKKFKNSKNEDCSATLKNTLNLMINLLCAETTPNITKFESIEKLLFYPSNMKFEMKTGIKCIHTLTSKLNDEYIKKLLKIYRQIICGESKKIIDEEDTKENWNNKEKQYALHIFTKTLKHPSLKKEINWKLDQIKFLFDISFIKKLKLSSEVQKCAKECFYKAVMLQMPSLKELVCFLDELALHLNENIERKNFIVTEETLGLWNKMFSVVQNLQKKTNNKLFIAVHVLLIYMGLYLFLDSELAKSGIEELISCYEHLKKVHNKKEDGPHWTEVTIDLILSLLSRENKVWRHVISCIFSQVVTQITPSALHQIIDALDPKGQNKILKHINSDDSESEAEEGSESSLSESEGSDLEEVDDGNVNDQLRMAVRNALGYSAALTDDESVDMDQMDEEEEKRLNESLSEAFKLFRQNKSQGKKKKQTKEEEALAHFRLRVLDLVEIYISSTPSLGGCLDLLLPLLDILELSIKDHHQRPLQNRVDSILKHISMIKNFSSLDCVTETVVKDVFESIVSRKEIPALIFVEMSPRISDCTTFLVRCSQLIQKENTEILLVKEYNSLLKEFFQSRDFKLPISMFQAVLRMTWSGNFKIVEILFEILAASNVRIFKKMKIIELLRIFYKNDKLHGSCDELTKSELNNIEINFIDNFVNILSEFEKDDSKTKEKMYLSFFSNVITLVNLIHTSSKRHRQETKKSPQWKKLILKLAELKIIAISKKTKSQLCNLGKIFKVEIFNNEKLNRKRTKSDSSIQKNESENEIEPELNPPKKKKIKKKISAEKIKLKKESQKLREEISSSGLEIIRFSTVNSNSLPDSEEIEEIVTHSKKRKNDKAE